MMKDEDVCRTLFHHHFPRVNPRSVENFQSAYRGVYSNLTKGVYGLRTLRTDYGGVLFSVATFDGKLFSSCYDNTIKVCDLETGECTATLRGHRGRVCSLASFEGKLFSGSYENTIKVWDLKTGECTATLKGHRKRVCSFANFDGKLFSGSKDRTIKAWDLETGECIGTLTGHQGLVASLAVFDGKLFSGSWDHTIKVWDLKTRQCRATLKGHGNSVSSLVLFDGNLFSGCDGGTIKVWDLKTERCTATLTGHKGSVASFAVFHGKLFSASSDDIIKIWELKTKRCTATLTGHVGGVFSLVVFDGNLISGSSDDTIQIWDFTADHRTIFKEIALLLENEEGQLRDALERFSRMPKTAKHAIYAKLYAICQPFAYPGCTEHAFHNEHGQTSTSAQKARAIRAYLNDQPPENNPLLLADLGIKMEKEYSKKLNCRSEYLEKIGILSREDLKLICLPSPQLVKLESLEILEVEEDFTDNKAKIVAERRKSNLITFTGEISEVVQDKIKETNTCGVILYKALCPWVSFQNKLKAFQGKLGEIAEESNTAKLIVEAFDSKHYNRLAHELNELVEEFHTLDRDHQISKLHAYVNQWGILTAWNNLRDQGVQNLSALRESKQSLEKLFQMGE
jgi:hypothetical protein